MRVDEDIEGMSIDEAIETARRAAAAGFRVDLVLDGVTGFADAQVRLPVYSPDLPKLLSFAAALDCRVIVAGDHGAFALLPIEDAR